MGTLDEEGATCAKWTDDMGSIAYKNDSIVNETLQRFATETINTRPIQFKRTLANNAFYFFF